MLINKDIITSRNNQFVKWAASLVNKKDRDASRRFIVEGEKLSFEAICAKLDVTDIIIAESKKEKYIKKLYDFDKLYNLDNTTVYILSDDAFSKISTEKAPQGIICIIKYLDFFRDLYIINNEEFSLLKNERCIMLFQIRDPGNLGAVIRSCVAFGCEHIILTEDCADVYNPKTVRSAMGSLFRVKITKVPDFLPMIGQLRNSGRNVYAAELRPGARSIREIDLRADDIFIIGNEGHGISTNISEACSGSVYIPISSNAESLNASVAASVIMWEQNNKE